MLGGGARYGGRLERARVADVSCVILIDLKVNPLKYIKPRFRPPADGPPFTFCYGNLGGGGRESDRQFIYKASEHHDKLAVLPQATEHADLDVYYEDGVPTHPFLRGTSYRCRPVLNIRCRHVRLEPDGGER